MPYDRSYYLRNREAIIKKTAAYYERNRKGRKRSAKWTNRYFANGDHWILEITHKKPDATVTKYRVLLDAEDVDAVRQHHYRLDRNLQPACWYDEDGVHQFFFLHRLIMEAADDQFVSNNTKNPLDLRKQNLNICDSMTCVFTTRTKNAKGIYAMHYPDRICIYTVMGNRRVHLWRGKRDALDECRKMLKKLRALPPSKLKVHLYNFLTKRKHIKKIKTGWTLTFRGIYCGYFQKFKAAQKERRRILREHVESVFRQT